MTALSTLSETKWAEDAENQLLTAALPHAARLGWTARLVAAGARDAGFTLPEADLLAPHGPRDLAALLFRRHDRAALETLSGVDPRSLKVRERIRQGVTARGDVAMADEGAVRSCAGFLCLPHNARLGLRLVWASADGIWRWAGDTATDENHYSKRVLLAEILITTLAVRLAAGPQAATAHLDDRIAGVMAFERWKAGLHPSDAAVRIAAALGRLRYGRR